MNNYITKCYNRVSTPIRSGSSFNMNNKYLKSIDALRVVSILAVLLIHTTTRTIEATHNDIVGFPITLFLNQISRFAVPLFFLISGLVLELNYNNHPSYFSYVKKRLSKILFPYLFWSLIYYFFVYTQNHDSLVRMFSTGNASYQLYFIPTLLIFYMIFPFLHKIYKVISNKFVFLFLGSLQVWLLYRDYFVKPFKYDDPIHIAILAFFVFIFGIITARNKDKILEFGQKLKYPVMALTGLVGFYVFLEGKISYLETSNYLSFYSQWRPSVLLYTIGVFTVLFYAFDKSHLQFNFVEKLSKLSYLVFFIHVIVLEKVWSFFGKSLFNSLTVNPLGRILFDPVFFVSVAFVSFVIANLIHKIPKVYKITG